MLGFLINMSIKEYPICYDSLGDDGDQLHRRWELNVMGTGLLFERYGSMCGWSQLKLKKNGAEVYRIVKPWGSEERTEFFFNQPTRTYMCNQLSFVEYLISVAEQERIPEAQEFVQAGLDAEVEKQYRKHLQKIIDTKTPLSN